jgi:carboxyl-terminal processing protease
MMKLVKSLIIGFALSAVFITPAFGQIRIDDVVGKSRPDLNRSRGYQMLSRIKETLEKYYYDKNYRGIDIEKRFKEAKEKIKNLETNTQIFRVIASILLEFNDSHTRFFPPNRSERVEYGFSLQMIGANPVVVDVKKGSDAEKKGLKDGDVISKIGQHAVTRDTLWVISYLIYQLEPMPLLPVTVLNPDKSERSIVVEASFKSLKERQKEAEKKKKETQDLPYKCAKLSADTNACKLRTFRVEKKYIDEIMKEAVTGTKLILDLRGNRGGLVKMEEYLTGHFFDKEIKIADMMWRNKTENRVAKPHKDRQFKGELIVLIDSESASASEVFARLIQIEKRGRIVGDVSAGAVMTSYNMTLANERGVDSYQTLSFYGLNVTVADLIMSDGGRLEGAGVSPDIPIGPTSRAVAARSDPVLAYAAGLFGAKLTPEEAGKLQFLFKKSEEDDDSEENRESKN